MITERMDDLHNELAEELRRLQGTAKYAEHFAAEAVAKMVDEGAAFQLTEDEDRMLRAYRTFRTRNAGGVFSWKVEASDAGIVIPYEPTLIIDPRDVSSNCVGPENAIGA